MNDQQIAPSEPRSIGGSLFGGDVTARQSLIVGGDLHLTVHGLGDDDLETLTTHVLAALRSDAHLAIFGGPGNTTILAANGEPRVVASREQGRALARRVKPG